MQASCGLHIRHCDCVQNYNYSGSINQTSLAQNSSYHLISVTFTPTAPGQAVNVFSGEKPLLSGPPSASTPWQIAELLGSAMLPSMPRTTAYSFTCTKCKVDLGCTQKSCIWLAFRARNWQQPRNYADLPGEHHNHGHCSANSATQLTTAQLTTTERGLH